MFKNLFKKKKKFKYVMIYKEIIDCSKFYVIHNFKTDKRKIIMKRSEKMIRELTEEQKEKVKEAKKELNEYRENIKYVQEKQDDIEDIRNTLVKTTTKLSPTKTSSGSMSTDKFSDGLDRIEEIEKDKNKKLAELLTKKFIIDEKIDKLQYPHRDVLFMRYARRKTWRDIATELDYDVRQIYRIHGKALLKYSEL